MCSLFSLARSLIGRAGELTIPFASAASLGYADGLVRPLQILDGKIEIDVMNDGSGGNTDIEVLAGFPEFLFSHSRLAMFRVPVTFSREIEERVELIVSNENDAATVTAVTAVRSAFWDEPLTPKAHTAVAAAACLDVYFRSIDEHNGLLYQKISMICTLSKSCF